MSRTKPNQIAKTAKIAIHQAATGPLSYDMGSDYEVEFLGAARLESKAGGTGPGDEGRGIRMIDPRQQQRSHELALALLVEVVERASAPIVALRHDPQVPRLLSHGGRPERRV